MAVIDGYLHIATSGGLLVEDPDFTLGARYTNLNGLGTVDLTDVTEDASGRIWLTGNGRLINFGVKAYPVIDNDGNRLRLLRVADDGGFLWVGYEGGLILWNKTFDGGQIQEAYDMFGDLNAAPDVFDIALWGDSIAIATSAGLALGDRSDTRALLNPANWTTYGRADYPELGTDDVISVARFESAVYCGTSAGLFRLDPILDTLVKLPFAPTYSVYQLQVEDDSLWVYSGGGLAVVVDAAISAVATPGVSGGVRAGIKYGPWRWLGGADDGLYYGTAGTYTAFPYVGMPDNEVADVAIHSDGALAVLYAFDGPYLLQAGGWVHLPVDVSSRGMALEAAGDGRLYVGTYGGGMSVVGDTVAQYKTANSTLQEAGAVGSDYVVCFDVAVTSRYFFGVNFEPRDGTRLAVADLRDLDNINNWTSFGVSDGLAGEQMVSVDFQNNAVAVGSGLAGAYYYYLGPDPFNTADDSLVNYTLNNDNFRYRILSDVVRVVRFAPDSELWVGTNYGISRFDRSLDMFVAVGLPEGFGPDISDIEFDSRGNAWVGANNGLARVDAHFGTAEVFTTDNSGLINNRVNKVTFNARNGNVYVATNSGLSVIRSIFGQPTSDLTNVRAFPNPFVIDSPDDRLSFNFAGNANLRIFTVAGELVAERAELTWDGRSASGKPVASGVYLFVLTDAEGNSGNGKFLLVRN